MDAEPALLAAIARHPHDDLPRLAYADWLDEHDCPVRAEFIRVQCAIAGLDAADQAVRNAHVHLWRRQQELLDDHRRDLLGDLADALGPFDADFARGFVSELRMDAERFLKHADAVRKLKPLPDVTVTDVGWWLENTCDVFDADCDDFRLATSIEMQSKRRPEPVVLGPDGIGAGFASYGPWPRLRELHLEGCQIQDGGVAALAAGDDEIPENFPALTVLDLSQNDVSDQGVRWLTERPLFARLRVLILGANPISDEGARMLAAAPGRLEYLNMKYTAITSAGQQALLRRKGVKVDLF